MRAPLLSALLASALLLSVGGCSSDPSVDPGDKPIYKSIAHAEESASAVNQFGAGTPYSEAKELYSNSTNRVDEPAQLKELDQSLIDMAQSIITELGVAPFDFPSEGAGAKYYLRANPGIVL